MSTKGKRLGTHVVAPLVIPPLFFLSTCIYGLMTKIPSILWIQLLTGKTLLWLKDDNGIFLLMLGSTTQGQCFIVLHCLAINNTRNQTFLFPFPKQHEHIRKSRGPLLLYHLACVRKGPLGEAYIKWNYYIII